MDRSSRSDNGVPLAGWRRYSWGVGLGLTVGLAGLVAGGAITQLLGVRSGECTTANSEELPATKLYCGQQSADKRTVEDLQAAIRWVNSIPADDPLRLSGDRKVREWSEELLRLSEGLYQDGQLEAAIAAVRSIPATAHLHAQVEQQVQDWQTTWEKAEALYEKTQQAIDDRQWGKGLSTARQILGLGNTHWQTVKYPELMDQLEAARNDQEGTAKVQRPPRNSKDLLAGWKLQPQTKLTSTPFQPKTSARSERLRDQAKSARPPSRAQPALPVDNRPPPAMPDLPPPAPLPVLPVVDTEPVPILGAPVDTLPQEFNSSSPATAPAASPAATP